MSVALLSRYPVEAASPFPLPPRNLSLHAVLRVHGRPLHVFVVHLFPACLTGIPLSEVAGAARQAYAARAGEVARLEEEVRALDEPALVLCDCNMTDMSEGYGRLRTFLGDSFREAGWGPGHRFGAHPWQRIDYVWHTRDLVALSAATLTSGGSDHMPVVAELRYASGR